MGTFSDLPRYPADSTDEPDGPSGADGGLRAALTVAQVAAEVLFFIILPLFALLWWVLCLPVLVVLIVSVETRDDRR